MQRSRVASSIYCRLKRSDSHPECNLAARRSDLHGLLVRFKSFNYSAACWRFKFGLLLLFCLHWHFFFFLPPSRRRLLWWCRCKKIMMICTPLCSLFQVCENACMLLRKNHSAKRNIQGFAFVANKCNCTSAEANLSEMLAVFAVTYLLCSGKEVM